MLELYHQQLCPYSKRVRDFIEDKNLKSDIKYLDIGDDARAADRLESMIGKAQVPCLVIDGRPLCESEAIIHWLNTNLVPSSAPKHLSP